MKIYRRTRSQPTKPTIQLYVSDSFHKRVCLEIATELICIICHTLLIGGQISVEKRHFIIGDYGSKICLKTTSTQTKNGENDHIRWPKKKKKKDLQKHDESERTERW